MILNNICILIFIVLFLLTYKNMGQNPEKTNILVSIFIECVKIVKTGFNLRQCDFSSHLAASSENMLIYYIKSTLEGFPGGAMVENPPANTGDTGSCPGPGRSHMPRSG